MREIKFRGKRKDNGEWVEGCYLETQMSGVYIINTKAQAKGKMPGKVTIGDKITHHEVDPATVGQFTGLRDIVRTEEFPEGQETFEDDLLQSQVGAMYIWQVKFEDGAYILEQINGPKKRGKQRHVQDFCCKDDIELYQLVKIGNIYDNPELLEGVAG